MLAGIEQPTSSMKVAREGYSFILTTGASAVAALALGWHLVGAILVVFALAFLGFFRDPERFPPGEEELILAPADGQVVSITDVKDGWVLPEASTRVSIFLSPLDVHINRSPIGGRVEDIWYQRGGFLAAYNDKASARNEQNALRIIDAKGRRIGVVQVAGVLARRIVCHAKKGDSLAQGDRFGLIMFGSRTDLYLPIGTRVEVLKGQRVRGGETIVGRFV